MPIETLLRDVDEFAEEAGLAEHAAILRKGALVARDPHNYRDVEGVTEEECEAIHNETARKWHHPKALYMTIVM